LRTKAAASSGNVVKFAKFTYDKRDEDRGEAMQKALIYEAIFIVNRGIDDAVSALERLKNNTEAKDAGLSPAFLDQKLVEFEMHRASLNGYFTNHLDSAEEAHACQLHKNYKQYRRKDLDEVQVYQDVELLEQRRWMEGKSPRVRFLSKEELRIHEGLPPKPNPDAEGTAASNKEPHD
jgi:hypothetical protein